MLNIKDRDEVLIQKIREIKNGHFKATAIKGELEAQLDRDYCDNDCQCDSESCWSVRKCQDYIMSRLVDSGLAERMPEGEDYYVGDHTELYSSYKPTGALKYLEFYRDGSVDSECTFTVSLEDEQSIYVLPKMVEIFKDLAHEIGGEFNTERAGMHLALLNDPDCHYPISASRDDRARAMNFRKSMTFLLPALFFLGSVNEISRELRFRKPRIATPDTGYMENKYSAIYYSGGAVEFRVFETCYDNPNAILDNVVVMVNCMRYWTLEYRPSGLAPSKQVYFGNDNSSSVTRFYSTMSHIELLNQGLRKLKPSYYTIKQIKQQRKFGMTKREIRKLDATRKEQAEREYLDYERRFGFETEMYRLRCKTDFLENRMYRATATVDEVLPMVDTEIERNVEDYISRKHPAVEWVASKVNELEREAAGRYQLEV